MAASGPYVGGRKARYMRGMGVLLCLFANAVRSSLLLRCSIFPGLRALRPAVKMKVVAAYLLALLGGNASPSAKDIEAILSSVGAEADSDRVSLLLKELEGKDILEVIAAGKEKFASVPSGGGGGVVVASGGGGAAAAPAAEEKKEEVKEEAKEESDDDMGFSLFD